MHRILLLILLVGSLVLGAGFVYNTYIQPSSLLSPDVKSASSAPNNILVFLMDDLDSQAFYSLLNGGKLPNIQSLINDGGKNFTSSYVVNSTCCPSRATLMTGTYSHNNGVYNVQGSNGSYTSTAFTSAIKSQNIGNWLVDTHDTAFIGKFLTNARSSQITCASNSDFPGWNYFELIGGYDPRPGAWSSSNCINPNQVFPFKYQLSYMADKTNQKMNEFIADGKKKNFLMVVAPPVPHVNPSQWKERNSEHIITGASVRQPSKPSVNDTDPIVAFNQLVMANDDPNTSYYDKGKDYQVVIKGTPQKGYTPYRRVSVYNNSDDYYQMNGKAPVTDWTNWENIGPLVSKEGRTAIPFVNGAKLQGLSTAFKSVTVEGKPVNLKYSHVLYNNKVYFTEDLFDAATSKITAKPWTENSVNNKTELNSIFAGTDPQEQIIEFAATDLPNNSKLQVLIRGTDGKYYRKFYRYNVNNKWTNWNESPIGWDFTSEGDNQIIGYSLSVRGLDRISGRYTEQLLRYVGNDTYKTYELKQPNLTRVFNARSECNLSDSGGENVLAASAGRPAIIDDSVIGVDMNYSGNSVNSQNKNAAASSFGVAAVPINSPHVYHAGRQTADGNWDFHNVFAQKCLTFNQNLYKGGKYPAGTLRIGSNKDGMQGLGGFALPQTPAFNAYNPNTKPEWIGGSYPDLNSKVYDGSLTQKDFVSRFWLDRNEAMISADVMLGEVIKNLKAKGQYDNTLIIFTSDNGHMNGEYRLQNKQVPYETSIKVPLVIKLPKNERASTVARPGRLVANIDIAPTILDYAGKDWTQSKYSSIDGRSLRPILSEGISNSADWRSTILIEREYPRMDINKIKKDKWGWGLADYNALRVIDYSKGPSNPESLMYVSYGLDPLPSDPDGNDTGKKELYNFRTDSYQLNNIASSNASLVNSLNAKLKLLKECKGASCRTADK